MCAGKMLNAPQLRSVFPYELKNAEPSIQYVLDVISNFFARTVEEGEKSFSELYNLLTSPYKGIGMKKGAIVIDIFTFYDNASPEDYEKLFT